MLDTRAQAAYRQYLETNKGLPPGEKEAQLKQLQKESTPAGGTH